MDIFIILISETDISLLQQDPVFFPFGEICARKVSRVQKRPSELTVSAPTRTALLQIALLKPGNMFVSEQPLDLCSYPGFLSVKFRLRSPDVEGNDCMN